MNGKFLAGTLVLSFIITPAYGMQYQQAVSQNRQLEQALPPQAYQSRQLAQALSPQAYQNRQLEQLYNSEPPRQAPPPPLPPLVKKAAANQTINQGPAQPQPATQQLNQALAIEAVNRNVVTALPALPGRRLPAMKPPRAQSHPVNMAPSPNLQNGSVHMNPPAPGHTPIAIPANALPININAQSSHLQPLPPQHKPVSIPANVVPININAQQAHMNRAPEHKQGAAPVTSAPLPANVLPSSLPPSVVYNGPLNQAETQQQFNEHAAQLAKSAQQSSRQGPHWHLWNKQLLARTVFDPESRFTQFDQSSYAYNMHDPSKIRPLLPITDILLDMTNDQIEFECVEAGNDIKFSKPYIMLKSNNRLLRAQFFHQLRTNSEFKRNIEQGMHTVNRQSKYPDGNTIIHLMAEEGDVDAIKQFIAARCNMSVPNAYGRRPLEVACINGHTEIVELLIKNYKNEAPVAAYALLVALKFDQQELAKNIIACHPAVLTYELPDSTESRLVLAAKKGFTDIVQLLIENGTHDAGALATALICAVRKGTIDSINLLSKDDAGLRHTDSEGFTLLHNAAFSAQSTRYLLQRGLVDIPNKDGITALYGAAAGGKREVVEQLLEAKKCHLLATQSAMEASRSARFSSDPLDTYTAESLDQYINKQTTSGKTALWQSIKNGHTDTTMLLIASGARLGQRESYEDGCTPLILAADCGNESIVSALLDSGVNANEANSRGETALFHAALKGHTTIVKTLIARGAHVNCQCNDGATPLYIATLNAKYATVKVLVEAGADGTLACRGKTPLHTAQTKRNGALVNLLVPTDMTAGDLQRYGINPHEPITVFGHGTNVQHHIQVTPLYIALFSPNPSLVNALLQAGVSLRTPCINYEGNGQSHFTFPLLSAVKKPFSKPNLLIIQQLLEQAKKEQLDFAQEDSSNRDILDIANPLYLPMLAQAGVDINRLKNDLTPLMLACIDSNIWLVYTLLEIPTLNLNIRNTENKTALDYVTIQRDCLGKWIMVRSLLDKGAQGNVPVLLGQLLNSDERKQNSDLFKHIMARLAPAPTVPPVRPMPAVGSIVVGSINGTPVGTTRVSTPQLPMPKQVTPAQASEQSDASFVHTYPDTFIFGLVHQKYLSTDAFNKIVAAGFNVNARLTDDPDKKTVLMLAAENRNMRLMGMLLTAGADPSLVTEGKGAPMTVVDLIKNNPGAPNMRRLITQHALWVSNNKKRPAERLEEETAGEAAQAATHASDTASTRDCAMQAVTDDAMSPQSAPEERQTDSCENKQKRHMAAASSADGAMDAEITPLTHLRMPEGHAATDETTEEDDSHLVAQAATKN